MSSAGRPWSSVTAWSRRRSAQTSGFTGPSASKALQEADHVHGRAGTVAGVGQAVGEDDRRQAGSERDLGDRWADAAARAHRLGGIGQRAHGPVVDQDDGHRVVARDHHRLRLQVDRQDVERRQDLARAVGAQVVRGGAGGRSVAHAVGQQADGLARDGVGDGLGRTCPKSARRPGRTTARRPAARSSRTSRRSLQSRTCRPWRPLRALP